MDLQDIKRITPDELDRFQKLEGGVDPYYFKEWDSIDDNILRYWFWNKNRTKKNVKRIFIHELENLLRRPSQTGEITRSDFESYCPKTKRDGDCGFAVIVRILEFLRIARYDQDSGVILITVNEKH